MKRLDSVIGEIDVDTLKANSPIISNTSEPTDECPICKGLGYVRENVPVDHPDFGKLFPCTCKLVEIEKQRLDNLRALSNLNHLSRMTFERFVPGGYGLSPEKATNLQMAHDLAHQYAQAPEGWLVLIGGYGCGKTHLAAAIANEVIDRGEPVLFIVVPDLLDYLRATFGPNSPATYDQRFDEVRNAPLLILDDLGTQSSTPWAQEKLFQILNYRYNARLPTIVTSNHRLEEIDLRIRSRLVDPGLARIVPILAPDFRRSGVDQDQSDLSSLSEMQGMTFETFDVRRGGLKPEEEDNLARAYEVCRDYARSPQGWLVLTGDYHCGKSHLAAAIANEVVSAGMPALFVMVPDLLDHLRATFSPNSAVQFDKRFQEVRQAPLLVLDDLGTESASPWAREKLYQLFNHRFNACLPTVITSSKPLEELDPRLRTRMLDLRRSTVFAILAPGYKGLAAGKSPRRRSQSRR